MNIVIIALILSIATYIFPQHSISFLFIFIFHVSIEILNKLKNIKSSIDNFIIEFRNRENSKSDKMDKELKRIKEYLSNLSK